MRSNDAIHAVESHDLDRFYICFPFFDADGRRSFQDFRYLESCPAARCIEWFEGGVHGRTLISLHVSYAESTFRIRTEVQ